jgi:hypothetical protein
MNRRSSASTIRDVARQAGVSVATVSRYINSDAPISPEVAAKLEKVMRELRYVPHSAAHHLAHHQVAEHTFRLIYVESESYPQLTPDLLGNLIYPYINAINLLQQVIDEIKLQHHRDIAIKEISQLSPVSVSLDGAGGAIRSIEDIVVPWRRKHYESMATLEEQEKQAEIENKKAEILEKRASAARDRAEAQKLLAEAQNSKLMNEKLKLEIQHAKINLALEILNSIDPNLSQTVKIGHLLKILKVIDVIGTSDFEFELVE